MAESIQTVSIAKETHERYLRYALSVITSRALPDVRDGLKPVQRRILYTMHHDLHLDFDGRPRKCAQIVGDVMGKYHPHGDSAIYDALVRLAQEWVMLVPLVKGQGNFGSYDGDPPAAYRYTEAKLGQMAEFLLRELKQDTVEMRPTYDSMRDEPVVLPAEFPNLLVNGSSGIAVGMATNIPPHNLGEIIRASISLIDDPNTTTAELLNKVKGPDFPLGGKIITDRATLRSIYENGEGSIKIQGEWELEGEGTKQPQIVITSIPFSIDKSKLEEAIGRIIEDRKVPEMIGFNNESNKKEGIRIVIHLKAGADPQKVMAYLFKHTEVQQNFSYNLTCLVPDAEGHPKPQKLGLKAILSHFLEFRLITVKKRLQFDLDQLRKRIHILEGFRIIFDALDKAIKIIRGSTGKADAAVKLMAEFDLDQIQTDAILDAQLYKIAQMEIKKILDELKEKLKEAKKLEDLLASEKRLWNLIKDELNAVSEKLPQKRRTRMATDEDVLEFSEEDYIVKENTNVVLTRDGWIKRVGRLASVEGTRVREGDEVVAVVPGTTLDHVAFFTDDGMVYTTRINEVPPSSGYGEPITKYFRLPDNFKIIAAAGSDPRFIPESIRPGKKEDPEGPYVMIVTAQGLTLRTPFAAYRVASTKAGRKIVRLAEGDKVVMARVLLDEESVLLASADGRIIHFPISDISVLSGAGKGVIGIKLDPKDHCLGGTLVSGRFDKIVVETTGGATKEYGRVAIPLVNRGGKGVEIAKRGGFTRILPMPIELPDWDEVEAGRPKTYSPPPELKTDRNGGDKSLFS
jgi:DNA gyrase subunit A